MNFFETVGGSRFIGKMEQNVSSIAKSLVTIATELKRSNDGAEEQAKPDEKAFLPFAYLLEFAESVELGNVVGCKQLRSLWTTYCIINEVNPDTKTYDTDLFTLWEIVQSVWIGTSFDEFDEFMCEDLC